MRDAHEHIWRKQIEPKRLRLPGSVWDSDASFGRNGAFQFGPIRVICSDGAGWDHVSVSLENRCPTWEEMHSVKELFFGDEECVMQLHPPKSQWVNNHPFCLHLWKPQYPHNIPVPPMFLVGTRELNVEVAK